MHKHKGKVSSPLDEVEKANYDKTVSRIEQELRTKQTELKHGVNPNTQEEIADILGFRLDLETTADEEVRQYARTLQNSTSKTQQSHSARKEVLPKSISTHMAHERKIFRVTHGNVIKAVLVEPTDSADDVISKWFTKMRTLVAKGYDKFQDDNEEDCVLKVNGAEEYLYGNEPIGNYTYVQREQNLAFTVVNIEQVLLAYGGGHRFDLDFTKQDAPMYNHDQLSYGNGQWEKLTKISVWDLDRHYRIRLNQLSFKTDEKVQDVYVTAQVMHGTYPLSAPIQSKIVPIENPTFNEHLTFKDTSISQLPISAHVKIVVYAKGDKDTPLLVHRMPVSVQDDTLRVGCHRLDMWVLNESNPDEHRFYGNNAEPNAPYIGIDLDRYALPVVFPRLGNVPKHLRTKYHEWETRIHNKFSNMTTKELESCIESVLESDPMYQLTEDEKSIVWVHRQDLISNPRALTKFIASIPYQHPIAVQESRDLIQTWAREQPVTAVPLLSNQFMDPVVRQSVVEQLNQMNDTELKQFILQLVQCIKYEQHHDSYLSRFLLQRAIASNTIGHTLFWTMKGELHDVQVKNRFGVMLSHYLMICRHQRKELLKSCMLVDQLLGIALRVKHEPDNLSRIALLRKEIVSVDILLKEIGPITLPLNCNMRVIGVQPERCRVMSSAKAPLWIRFITADDCYLNVMYKAGDDMRQDLLTLQMLRIMDGLWASQGLKLNVSAYDCVCTGYMSGFIELVPNSDTIAGITHEIGGATSAYSDEPLLRWLRHHNPSTDKMIKVENNFVLSSAAYAVATFVLGIGDRHNDNIMLDRSGNLFHIDFGHFLGVKKKFLGVKRETTPFVFTPMYAKVIGGVGSEAFEDFVDLSTQAFNILRKFGDLFMALFDIMVVAGIPELKNVENVLYLKDTLFLGRINSNEEAALVWKKLINFSLQNKRIILMDFWHIFYHKNIKK
jgi:phosphatidylinositol-4,5-bisphosphate 3-kinase